MQDELVRHGCLAGIRRTKEHLNGILSSRWVTQRVGLMGYLCFREVKNTGGGYHVFKLVRFGSYVYILVSGSFIWMISKLMREICAVECVGCCVG